MKKITFIILLFSLTLLSSCIMNSDDNRNDKKDNKEIYIETTDGGGEGVPIESQIGAR